MLSVHNHPKERVNCVSVHVHLWMFVADSLEQHLKVGSAEMSFALESGEQTVACHVLEVLLTDVLQQ